VKTSTAVKVLILLFLVVIYVVRAASTFIYVNEDAVILFFIGLAIGSILSDVSEF